MVNKKVFISLLIMVVVLGLASAGTFAYFDDTQTTTGNAITTGTLKLNTEITNVVLTVTNALPGDTDKTFGTPFAITNTGTTSGVVTATMTDITNGAVFGNDLEIDIMKQDGTYTPIYKDGAVIPVTLSGNFASGATFNENLKYTYIQTTQVQPQGQTFGFKLQYEITQAP
jgi:predicted ribosomally synthesized peptide with SipW-like signal peptide